MFQIASEYGIEGLLMCAYVTKLDAKYYRERRITFAKLTDWSFV